MLHFITDVLGHEPDILPELKHEPLTFRALQGEIIRCWGAPVEGWSHDKLVAIATVHAPLTSEGADAYLGNEWVGSTEV